MRSRRQRGGVTLAAMQDRLFRVIVLGGIGLVTGSCGGKVVVDEPPAGAGAGVGGASSRSSHASSSAAQGGTGGYAQSSAIAGSGGFPQEGPSFDAGPPCFPSETAVNMCPDAGPLDSGFPQEANAPVFDAGPVTDSGFPQEV
jgi:hypothetical protein